MAKLRQNLLYLQGGTTLIVAKKAKGGIKKEKSRYEKVKSISYEDQDGKGRKATGTHPQG